MNQILDINKIKDDDIFDVESAAKFLRMRRSSIYQLTCKRKLRYFKLNQRRIYFLKSDLLKFLFDPKNCVMSETELEKQAQEKLAD